MSETNRERAQRMTKHALRNMERRFGYHSDFYDEDSITAMYERELNEAVEQAVSNLDPCAKDGHNYVQNEHPIYANIYHCTKCARRRQIE